MSIPLEDSHEDVISKARRGLRREGSATPDADDTAGLRAAAAELDLDADALVALAQGRHQPAIDPPAGFAAFLTDFNGMGVNSYLAWDPAARAAVGFRHRWGCGGDATGDSCPRAAG